MDAGLEEEIGQQNVMEIELTEFRNRIKGGSFINESHVNSHRKGQ